MKYKYEDENPADEFDDDYDNMYETYMYGIEILDPELAEYMSSYVFLARDKFGDKKGSR